MRYTLVEALLMLKSYNMTNINWQEKECLFIKEGGEIYRQYAVGVHYPYQFQINNLEELHEVREWVIVEPE